jgi:flagellar motor switch protein FliN
MLTPIKPKLSAQFWYERTEKLDSIEWERPEPGVIDIGKIPITLKAELFTRICTMDEIIRWKKRTVIYPHQKTNLRKCTVKIDDFSMFNAGMVNDLTFPNQTIQIEELLDPYKEHFMETQTAQAGGFDASGISGALKDVNIQVSVELGRTRRMIKEILSMGEGTIVELDKLAGEPVDILANNVPIARGEVVVIDENFGVRITELLNTQK